MIKDLAFGGQVLGKQNTKRENDIWWCYPPYKGFSRGLGGGGMNLLHELQRTLFDLILPRLLSILFWICVCFEYPNTWLTPTFLWPSSIDFIAWFFFVKWNFLLSKEYLQNQKVMFMLLNKINLLSTFFLFQLSPPPIFYT